MNSVKIWFLFMRNSCVVQVDARAIPDGDTITVYVSAAEPRESACVPGDVQMAAVRRSKARAERNYEQADALHQKIINAGYRLAIHLVIITFG